MYIPYGYSYIFKRVYYSGGGGWYDWDKFEGSRISLS